MKKLGSLLLAFVMSFTLVGCGSSDDSTSTLEAIQEAGVLKVGVKDDRVNFGLLDTSTGEYEGYEIDIAHKLAEEILGDADAVEFTAVNAKTRTNLLDNGEIDCVVATFTITEEREESWNFSDPYYTDYVGIMVKKGAYGSLADMDGATVAVQQSSTSRDSLEEAAADLNVSLTYKEFSTASECVTALNSGTVDAYSIDVTSLLSYLNDDLEILPDRFSPQDFGVATRKDDQEFSDKINEIIQELEADGTLDEWKEAYGIAEEA